MKDKKNYGSSNPSNNKYMGGMKVPPDFGDAGKVIHINTMNGHGGKVDMEPCQYSSSYSREAYNYKY